MDKGWNAKGLLRPLWQQLDGPGKREQLGELAGITPQTLSAYNTGPDDGGRPLGITNARKIVAALATKGIRVSLLELGAPEGEADVRGQTMLDRLEELSTKLGDSIEEQAKLTRKVTALQARVRKLEGQRGGVAAAPSSPRKRASQ